MGGGSVRWRGGVWEWWALLVGALLGCQAPEPAARTPAPASAGSPFEPPDGGPVDAATGDAATGAGGPRVTDAATAAAASPSDAAAPPATDAGADSGVSDAAVADDRCDVGRFDGTPPLPLQLSGHRFAHDPTMLEVDGVFYRFWTGDGIPSATSTDLVHWTPAAPVFDAGYPQWVGEWLAGVPGQTFNFPWAPDVSRFHGAVHLYPSWSAKFGDNISCLGHLTTDDIAAGHWTDHGPVLCTEGDERHNAIDADVALDRDGTPWLAFGSFWDGIMATPLDVQGKPTGQALTRLAWAPEIEAPVLLRRCGYYYLFVTWGLCCPGAGRDVDDLSYRVVVGRSERIDGPYVDRDGTPMLEGGGTPVVQGDATYAAAGHSDVIVVGDRIYHLYHAYRRSDGGAELRIVDLPFDADGWPVPGGP